MTLFIGKFLCNKRKGFQTLLNTPPLIFTPFPHPRPHKTHMHGLGGVPRVFNFPCLPMICTKLFALYKCFSCEYWFPDSTIMPQMRRRLQIKSCFWSYIEKRSEQKYKPIIRIWCYNNESVWAVKKYHQNKRECQRGKNSVELWSRKEWKFGKQSRGEAVLTERITSAKKTSISLALSLWPMCLSIFPMRMKVKEILTSLTPLTIICWTQSSVPSLRKYYV